MQPKSEPLNGRTVGAVYAIAPIFSMLAILECFYNCIEFHAYPIIPSLFLKNLVTKFRYFHFCKRHIAAVYCPIGIILLSNLDNTPRIIKNKIYPKPFSQFWETVNTNFFLIFAVNLWFTAIPKILLFTNMLTSKTFYEFFSDLKYLLNFCRNNHLKKGEEK